MIPAVVFVLPTGPTIKAMNAFDFRNPSTDFGGV
jgi:hypothetical protein